MNARCESTPEAAVEGGARFEAKDTLEIEFGDELIDRRLAVPAVHFSDDQLGAVGVVEGTELACTFKSWRALSRVWIRSSC